MGVSLPDLANDYLTTSRLESEVLRPSCKDARLPMFDPTRALNTLFLGSRICCNCSGPLL